MRSRRSYSKCTRRYRGHPDVAQTTLPKATNWGRRSAGNRQQIHYHLMPGKSGTTTISPARERARAAPSLACCADGNGQLALLGTGNGCRRFPLRPRHGLARVEWRVHRDAGFLDAMAQDPRCRRSSRSEPQIPARADTRSAISRRAGRSGTTSIGTPCAGSGRVTRAIYRPSPRGFPDRPTSTAAGAVPGPASTSYRP